MLRADRQRLLEIAACISCASILPSVPPSSESAMRVLFRATRVPALDGSGSTSPVHECARGGSVGDERSSLPAASQPYQHANVSWVAPNH